MFDVWPGEFDLTTLTPLLSVFRLLPLQLLLCFKVRSLILRLLPVILCALLTGLFLVLAHAAPAGTAWVTSSWLCSPGSCWPPATSAGDLGHHKQNKIVRSKERRVPLDTPLFLLSLIRRFDPAGPTSPSSGNACQRLLRQFPPQNSPSAWHTPP